MYSFLKTYYLSRKYAPLNQAQRFYSKKAESFKVTYSIEKMKNLKCFQLDQNNLYKQDRVYAPVYAPVYQPTYGLMQSSEDMVSQFSLAVLKLAEILQTATYLQNILIHNKFNVFLIGELAEFKNNGVWTWEVLNYVMTHVGKIIKNNEVDGEFRTYQLGRVFGKHGPEQQWVLEFITDVVRNFYGRMQEIVVEQSGIVMKIAARARALRVERELKDKSLANIVSKCTKNDWSMWDIQDFKKILHDSEEKHEPNKELVQYSKILMDHLLFQLEFIQFMNQCHVIQLFKNDIISSYRCIAPKGARQHPQMFTNDQKCIQFTKSGLQIVPNFKQLYLDNIHRVRKECQSHSGMKNNKTLLINDKLCYMKLDNETISSQQIILWVLEALESMASLNVYLTSYVDPVWTLQRSIMLDHPCSMAEYLERKGDSSVVQLINDARNRKTTGLTDEEEEQNQVSRKVRRLIGIYANSSVGVWQAQQRWKDYFGYTPRSSLNRKIQWMSVHSNQLISTMVKISSRYIDYSYQRVPPLIKYLADVVQRFFRNIQPSPMTFRLDDLYRYWVANNKSAQPHVTNLRPFVYLLTLIQKISRLKQEPAQDLFKKKTNVEIQDVKELQKFDILSQLIKQSQAQQIEQPQFESDDQKKSIKSIKSQGAAISKFKKSKAESFSYLSASSESASSDFQQLQSKSQIKQVIEPSQCSQLKSVIVIMDKLQISSSSSFQLI